MIIKQTKNFNAVTICTESGVCTVTKVATNDFQYIGSDFGSSLQPEEVVYLCQKGNSLIADQLGNSLTYACALQLLTREAFVRRSLATFLTLRSKGYAVWRTSSERLKASEWFRSLEAEIDAFSFVVYNQGTRFRKSQPPSPSWLVAVADCSAPPLGGFVQAILQVQRQSRVSCLIAIESSDGGVSFLSVEDLFKSAVIDRNRAVAAPDCELAASETECKAANGARQLKKALPAKRSVNDLDSAVFTAYRNEGTTCS